jgi:Dyp-type peroxidase family
VAQAKGILPRGEDRLVLYKSPRACGYFVSVKLDAAIDRARTETFLKTLSALVDELVARGAAAAGQAKGEKIAAVAVGFAPAFFVKAATFDPPVKPPSAFDSNPNKPLPNATPPLSAVPQLDAEIMLYVVSTFEARVNNLVSKISALKPDVQSVVIDRGYQREDGTEPFGYADGLRNVHPDDRPRIVFVHRDGQQLEEPPWADGGSYMTFMRILQRPEQLAALADDGARDVVIGRTKDGTRLDLAGQGVNARHEPAEPAPNLPAGAHVGKAGPRAQRDDNQIFRRGLPFMETSADGQLRVGLNFCSFQASLEQFDVIFNDWMMNPRFPSDGNAADALMDPARQFTQVEKAGFFFVPPYDEGGLAAAVLKPEPSNPPKHTTGRLVIKKRVLDPTDPSRRFERRGFGFEIRDASEQPVAGATFTTDSSGRGVCPVELEIGQTYVAHETAVPVANVNPVDTQFVMDKQNVELVVVNQVTQPNTPYGG